MSSGIDPISTEAKRLIQEREEQVKGLFGELQKARRELSTVVDRSEYQTSRIEILEGEVRSLRSNIASLEGSLREVTEKNLSENKKGVPRRERT